MSQNSKTLKSFRRTKARRLFSLWTPLLFLSVLILFLLQASCVQYTHRLDHPTSGTGPDGYRFQSLNLGKHNSDSLFVVLNFSGGGTRAAALTYGVLKELSQTSIEWEGERRSLLEEVDIVSGVSGGAFTAAYYALFRDRTFADFEHVFLKTNVTRALLLRLLNPWNLIRLPGSGFDRSDIAIAYYDDYIFKHKTYADLPLERPYLMLNASDISSGTRFPFIKTRLDPVCADLNQVKIGVAVAASSAFPGLLSPVRFKTYTGQCGYVEPEWVSRVIKNDYYSNRRGYQYAREVRSFSDPRIKFVHLVDGGVSDNLGVRAIINDLSFEYAPESLVSWLGDPIKKMVVVTVNAKAGESPAFGESQGAPGLVTVTKQAAFSEMDNFSEDSIQVLQDVFDERRKHAEPRVEIIPITIEFDGLQDEAQLKSFTSIPTSFYLASETVKRLEDIGAQLLRENRLFTNFCQDVKCIRAASANRP
jgi:NTE family protein